MATSKTVKTPVKAPVPKPVDHIVLMDGWIAGKHRKKGETISLTEGAAKYEVLGGKLKVKTARKAAKSSATPKATSKAAPKPATAKD